MGEKVLIACIGILVWQLLGLLVLILTDEDEGKTISVILFVPLCLISGFGSIYSPLRLAYFRRNYIRVDFVDKHGRKGTLGDVESTWYVPLKLVRGLETNPGAEKHIVSKTCRDAKSIPFKSQILTRKILKERYSEWER